MKKVYDCEDLTWFEFNRLVFNESMANRSIDERIKFLAISSTNLEEFSRIRIAKLQKEHNLEKIAEINEVMIKFIEEQERVYNCLLPEFSKVYGKCILSENQLTSDMIQSILYNINVRSISEVDSSFNADSMYLLVENLSSTDISIVEIPSTVKRVHELSSGLVLVEDMVKSYLKQKARTPLNISTFRITRDTVYKIEDRDTLILDLQHQIANRNSRPVTRLEVESGMSSKCLELLKDKFDILDQQVYYFNIPIYLGFLMDLVNMDVNVESKVMDEFKYSTIFDTLNDKDMILEHPFESFENVSNFIELCCTDRYVTHIYQTIYRVSKNSKIVENLIKASELGKEVTIYIEIGSPNDEERNIELVKKLKQTKCNIVYRYRGLTTHAKCFIAVRTKDGVTKKYSHIATGNYNENTAKSFIDLSYFTSDEKICSDVSKIFEQMYYNTKCSFDKLLVTQNNFRSTILKCIDNEMQNAVKGLKSNIKIKINALTDEAVINKLYDAAELGVKIDLIVRGACKLKSELNKNITKNILVGDLLHHNRIYYFENSGDPNIFVGSVDLVTDKIDNRIDFIYPTNGECKAKVLDLIKRDFDIK